MEVIEDFTPPKRPEEISTLLFQKFIVFDSSNIRLFTFSKEEIQYLKEMKCGWFYFELDEALHLGDFSSCEEKIEGRTYENFYSISRTRNESSSWSAFNMEEDIKEFKKILSE